MLASAHAESALWCALNGIRHCQLPFQSLPSLVLCASPLFKAVEVVGE